MSYSAGIVTVGWSVLDIGFAFSVGWLPDVRRRHAWLD